MLKLLRGSMVGLWCGLPDCCIGENMREGERKTKKQERERERERERARV